MPAGNNASPYRVRTVDNLAIHAQSAFFDGVDSYVAIPDSPSLRFATTGMTVSMWIMIPPGGLPSELGRLFNVLDKQNDQNGWGLGITPSASAACPAGNCPYFYTKGNGQVNWVTANVSLRENNGVHVTATYQPGGSVSIYVGGAPAGSTPCTITPSDNNQAFWIGSSAYWRNNYAAAYIDEVGFWQQALSAAQVRALYNSVVSGGSGPL
jgi:hypothetical protein